MAPHNPITSTERFVDDATRVVPRSSSTPSDTIATSVFGVCALVIGLVTIWQGRRLYNTWYGTQPDAACEGPDGIANLVVQVDECLD